MSYIIKQFSAATRMPGIRAVGVWPETVWPACPPGDGRPPISYRRQTAATYTSNREIVLVLSRVADRRGRECAGVYSWFQNGSPGSYCWPWGLWGPAPIRPSFSRFLRTTVHMAFRPAGRMSSVWLYLGDRLGGAPPRREWPHPDPGPACTFLPRRAAFVLVWFCLAPRVLGKALSDTI